MLKRYDDFFTKEECTSLLTEVQQYREHWKLNPITHYNTLGNCLFSAMSRLGINNIRNYASETTIELDVYKLFKEKIEILFPKVEFTKTFGKPGYSIITPGYDKAGLWHYDNELPLFPYRAEFADYNNTFHAYFDSVYTFVIMLSEGEHSFDYYPDTISEYKDTPEEEMLNYVCKDHVKLVGDVCPNINCPLTTYQRINYNQGTLLELFHALNVFYFFVRHLR